MIVFVVAAVLGIGVLAALWFAWEPLFPAIAWLMSMPWFFVVEAVLLGITALGLLVVLIRAITAPGKNSQLELERDNGSIAITQNAIQSTVKHVVESHHGLSTDNVKVHITNKHDPRMSIHAKIDPGRNAELGQLGAKLQDEIAATLEAFTPYVENHSHAVLYGIIGFVAAALILIVGFWPTVLLAVFAAIGVVIGKYRDGDRKTRQQMKQVLERFN